VGETFLVDRFEEPGAEVAMDLDGAADDLAGVEGTRYARPSRCRCPSFFVFLFAARSDNRVTEGGAKLLASSPHRTGQAVFPHPALLQCASVHQELEQASASG
jgi:hypothetical protein